MPSYIFSCRHDGLAEVIERDCQGREQAVLYARRYAEVALQERGPPGSSASVSVAEQHPAQEPQWIGAWDWDGERDWTWSPIE